MECGVGREGMLDPAALDAAQVAQLRTEGWLEPRARHLVKPDIDDWLSVHSSLTRHAAGRELPRLLIGSGSRQAEKLGDGVGAPMSNVSANNRFCIPAYRRWRSCARASALGSAATSLTSSPACQNRQF